MPIYEYDCGDCGHRFEVISSHSKSDDVSCERCDGQNTSRLISTFGVATGAAVGGGERKAVPPSGHQCGSGCRH